MSQLTGCFRAGVILAVGANDAAFVRTTALWCLLGTGTMVALGGDVPVIGTLCTFDSPE